MSVAKISLQALKDARQHQDALTKPQGALGSLEDIACWFAARQCKSIPDAIVPHICVFAADHDVVDEGVSAFPSVVTGEMVKNFVAGGAAINVLAAQCGASLSIVDVGVASDMSAIEGVVHANIRHGSRNIVHEAAMSDDEYRQAIRVGEQQAEDAIAKGANLLIAGDMGIGNTTASAALICELALLPPEQVVGRGTGVDDDAYQLKLAAVRKALMRAKNTPFSEALRELGGLEIAAMAGYYAASARLGVPVLLDGFISTAAALAAVAWDARIAGWMLASHVSEELGHQKALEALGLDAYLQFHLRLGEGSGAALLIPLLQSAIALHRNMATFASAGVSDKDA